MKILSQDSLFPVRESKTGPTEYEVGLCNYLVQMFDTLLLYGT